MMPERNGSTERELQSAGEKRQWKDWAIGHFSSFGQIPATVTIITAAAFLLGIFINSIIFSFWGMSFIQIATAWDVVMSGIQISAFLLIFLATSILVRITGIRTSRILVGVIFVAGEVILAVLIFNDMISRLAAMILLVIWAGVFLTIYSINGFNNITRTISRILALGGFILVAGMFLVVVIYSAIYKGYSFPGSVTADFPNCYFADVMWIGERVIVVRCKDDSFMAIRDPESVTFRLTARSDRLPSNYSGLMRRTLSVPPTVTARDEPMVVPRAK